MKQYLKIKIFILMMFGFSFSQTQPDLTVLFDQFDSTVTVYVDGDEIVIEADGVPGHLSPYFVQTYNQSNNGFYFWEDSDGDGINDLWMVTPSNMNLNPNRIAGQSYEFRVPLHPEINPNGPSDTFLGPIGASINGVPFFNEYESPTETLTNQVIQSFDPGNGHPAPQGRYHYHFPPESLYTVTEDNFLGFAADGFPVYGPKNPDSTNAQNLDDYHGEYGPTPDFPDSIYHYHTNFNTPYIIGAFAGTVGTGFGGGGGGGDPPDCDEVPPGQPCCGDGICGGPENETNCPEDCSSNVSLDYNSILPNKFSLEQNVPNPFNPTTIIRFNIPGSVGARHVSPLQLRIYDITSRLVETLLEEKLESGIHEVQWDASNQPSGVYFAELISGDVRKIRKMILLK